MLQSSLAYLGSKNVQICIENSEKLKLEKVLKV